MNTDNRKIAIIGAGVAGLSTARQLIGAGFDCTLFERNAVLGGVWSDGYLNFGAQVQRELYEFPDWPLPQGTPDFTPGPIIQKYLQDYADHHGISSKIRFNTRVTSLAENDSSDAGWTLTSDKERETNAEHFDQVVICVGLYSDTPNIPDFSGRDSFHGEVFHNSLLKSDEQLKGKRVAIIGYGKGATDAALEAAKVAEQTHLVFREPHWPIPQKLGGILPFKWGLLNRLCSTLIPAYQKTTPIERTMHGIGKPLAWFYWRVVETLFYFQCRLGSHFGTRVSLVSKLPVEIDSFGESTQAPKPEFFRLARTGHIDLHRTSVEAFTEDGLQLGDGTALDLDTVILATGWKVDFSFISPDVWARLDPGDDGFYLYRHIVNPNVPTLFFIGRAATITCILTFSLQARWLANVLSGKVRLPSDEEMRQNIEDMKAWKRSWMPFSSARSARLLAHSLHYHDELVKDLGESPLRKTGFFAPLKELIFAYEPKDYASIVSADEDRR
ncbi:MAG: NAD(P)/FAD-dependent oxidoreductase [Proteobacteria bacterium]|nr:NAD(P)/FAD-dependent oxidoreductase [Pseudomonadota bacterium]